MIRSSRLQPFATAQEAGHELPNRELQDRVRVGEVRMASGDRATLLVVADGEGGPGVGRAAQRVLEQVFQVLAASRSRDLGLGLRRGLEIGSKMIRRGAGTGRMGDRVAITAVAVRRNRLFYAHAGHCIALQIRGGDVVTLAQPTDCLLGDDAEPRIQVGPAEGHPLQKGDRIVVMSDGLVAASPEDGRPYLDPAQIPEYVHGVPALEAARHLISLALGRDATDDLSVAVYAVPGMAKSSRRRLLLPAALAAALVVLAVVIRLTPWLGSDAVRSVEYGYAVLIDGAMTADPGGGEPSSQVQRLEPISGGAALVTNSPVKAGLDSTHDAGSDLSLTSLFMDTGTRLTLTSLDRRVAGDQESPSSGSELALHFGRLLLLRESGTRELEVVAADASGALLGSGRAILAVEVHAEGTEVSCLLGTCSVQFPGGDRMLLQTGQAAGLRAGEIHGPGPISSQQMEPWDQLCSGCLLGDA